VGACVCLLFHHQRDATLVAERAPAALAIPTPGTRADIAVVAPSTDDPGRNLPQRTRSSEARLTFWPYTLRQRRAGHRQPDHRAVGPIAVGLGARQGHISARPVYHWWAIWSGCNGIPALAVARAGDAPRTDTVVTTWQGSLERVRPIPDAVTPPEGGSPASPTSPDRLPPCRLISTTGGSADSGRRHYGWKTTVRRP
jgi:hypothetical protein